MQAHSRLNDFTSRDEDMCLRSYLTLDIIRHEGWFRVPSIEGAMYTDRERVPGDWSGIIIVWRRPPPLPSPKSVVLYQLRLDTLPAGKNFRYLQAPGARNTFYYSTMIDPAWINDLSVGVVFVEGAKKAVALQRALLEAVTNGTGKPSHIALGINGAYGFRTQRGIVTNAQGQRVPVTGVVADLDVLPFHDAASNRSREVVLLYDSNVASNPKVSAGRRNFAKELLARQAEVRFAAIPIEPGVNGIDDYLALHGRDAGLAIIAASISHDWREELILTKKGTPAAVLANAITALRYAPPWTGALTYNEFSMEISTVRPVPLASASVMHVVESWTDQEDRLFCNWLQHHGVLVQHLICGAAVETAAKLASFHPVRRYLDSLAWDGVPRIDRWLITYCSAQDTDLTRAYSAMWLIAAVARIYDPGCKLDTALILEGAQGDRKSMLFQVLGGEWFTDDVPDLRTKDASMTTIGAWIIEMPELDAMSKAEETRVKSFLSRQTDRFRPPYGRRMIKAPRQCIFCGTTNAHEYLTDPTGARRFWSVAIGKAIDIDGLRRDRDQLWAEAAARYRQGEHWWLEEPKLIASAAEEAEKRFEVDPWEEPIGVYLNANHFRGQGVTISELLQNALHIPVDRREHRHNTRVGKILRRLQWEPQGVHRPRKYHPIP
jgi:predicted P-loop ATPase